MLKIRKSEERGHVQFTWLDTRHSFSFGSYCDPSFMGFRNLRVINEDKDRSRPRVPNSRSSRHVNYHLHDFGALEH